MNDESLLHRKHYAYTRDRADALYRELGSQQRELESQDLDQREFKARMKDLKAKADAEIEEHQQRQWKAHNTCNAEFTKCEKYCRQQRELLRDLEDLEKQEREMYELDNRKDQIMTICKVSLANLGMWVRDHYFPTSYAHTSWDRLQVFFQLPGRIIWRTESVEVELKCFNDCALNRDLEALCAKVAKVQPNLPDGHRLVFRMQGSGTLHLATQERWRETLLNGFDITPYWSPMSSRRFLTAPSP
jgi:hypothetical protein